MQSIRAPQEFAENVSSQFGEDGIIAEILDRIEAGQPLSQWSCEFGAADGVWFSNTCNLIRNRGFRAVMIEAKPEQANKLAENHPGPEVIKLIRRVGFEGADRLDSILDELEVTRDLDLLSMDIDGYDYCSEWESQPPRSKTCVMTLTASPTRDRRPSAAEGGGSIFWRAPCCR